MNVIDPIELGKVVTACQRGLLRLSAAPGSAFNGFPKGSCGLAADIIGRILKETLQYEGVYVCGRHHPSLNSEATHAWFEIGHFLIDVTYNQFPRTNLTGWVFDGGTEWHKQFSSLERRKGYCAPSGWPCYPYDGYKAALEEVKAAYI